MTGRSGRRALERAVNAIEGQGWLDRPSYRLEHVLTLGLNLFGGATQEVRNLLHGKWLGHPVHPLLVHAPIGAWTVALLLDEIDAWLPAGHQSGQGPGLRDTAQTASGSA